MQSKPLDLLDSERGVVNLRSLYGKECWPEGKERASEHVSSWLKIFSFSQLINPSH